MAEDIMVKDVKIISHESTTYEDIRSLLSQNEGLRAFPLVENKSKVLRLECCPSISH